MLQLLGKESVDMHSSTDSITLGENMIDVQKALCIAERQADILSMRVAIPKSTVPTVIRERSNRLIYEFVDRLKKRSECVGNI